MILEFRFYDNSFASPIFISISYSYSFFPLLIVNSSSLSISLSLSLCFCRYYLDLLVAIGYSIGGYSSEIMEILDLADFYEIPETGLPAEYYAVLGRIFSCFEILNY